MNELQTRAKIRELQGLLLAVPENLRINPTVEHVHLNGLYMRRMILPKDGVLVGKTHTKDHVLIINNGSGIMINEFGRLRIKAGDIINGEAGTKRAFKADFGLELITVHPNPENKSTEELEKELVLDI